MEDKFKEFIEKHKDLINSITPKNPSIGINDEWRDDNEFNRWCDDFTRRDYITMDITMCTAVGCPKANECARKTRGDPDDINQSYANLEYFCHSNNGFPDFIPLYIER